VRILSHNGVDVLEDSARLLVLRDIFGVIFELTHQVLVAALIESLLEESILL